MHASCRIRVSPALVHRMHRTMTMAQIGRRFGVTRQAISEFLIRYGGGRHYDHRTDIHITPLHRQVLSQLRKRQPTRVITRSLGCSPSVVYKLARRYHLPLTPPPEPRYMRYLRDRRWLYRQYVVERRTSTAIAAAIGCCFTPVLVWLRKHRIPVRSRGWLAGRRRSF